MQITLENGRILNVEKVPLGKFAELLKAFEELPKQFDTFTNLKSGSTEQFVAIIPKILGSCLPDFLRIIPIATELTPEEAEKLDVPELIDILAAIYTVNRFQAAFEKLKKYLPQTATSIKSLTPTSLEQ